MAKRINLDLVLLRKLYEDDKLAIRDIAIVMKCSETKIRRELNKLGFNLGAVNPFAREDVKAKIKQTIKDKYGVDNISQLESVKSKKKEKSINSVNKRKKTMIDRYGVDNVNLIPDKRKQMTDSIKKTLDNKSYKTLIDELYSENNYKDYIIELTNKLNRKPTLAEISKNLGINGNTILRYTRLYNAENLVDKVQSHLELSLEDFIKTLNINYVKHDRTQIKPLELDFYFPEYKVALEFNDIVSHNSTKGFRNNAPTPANYHVNKSKLCEDKGIRLIHIWEYEWFNERQRPILENIIKNALDLCTDRIYARKCNIKVITPTSKLREFFDENNIQGFRPGKFAICLEYNSKIVMSYIFGHCFFGKGKYECEVIRGATKLNCNVIGGASKIWKYFIENYNYNNCVYYIDYNYFNGNSLPYLGLKYITTQAGFKNYFVKENIVRNRSPQNHNEILKMYKSGEVLKIYNAGTKVYTWYRNES